MASASRSSSQYLGHSRASAPSSAKTGSCGTVGSGTTTPSALAPIAASWNSPSSQGSSGSAFCHEQQLAWQGPSGLQQVLGWHASSLTYVRRKQSNGTSIGIPPRYCWYKSVRSASLLQYRTGPGPSAGTPVPVLYAPRASHPKRRKLRCRRLLCSPTLKWTMPRPVQTRQRASPTPLSMTTTMRSGGFSLEHEAS